MGSAAWLRAYVGARPTRGAKNGAPVASSLGCACAARAASSLFATFLAWSYSLPGARAAVTMLGRAMCGSLEWSAVLISLKRGFITDQLVSEGQAVCEKLAVTGWRHLCPA